MTSDYFRDIMLEKFTVKICHLAQDITKYYIGRCCCCCCTYDNKSVYTCVTNDNPSGIWFTWFVSLTALTAEIPSWLESASFDLPGNVKYSVTCNKMLPEVIIFETDVLSDQLPDTHMYYRWNSKFLTSYKHAHAHILTAIYSPVNLRWQVAPSFSQQDILVWRFTYLTLPSNHTDWASPIYIHYDSQRERGITPFYIDSPTSVPQTNDKLPHEIDALICQIHTWQLQC